MSVPYYFPRAASELYTVDGIIDQGISGYFQHKY